MKAIKGLLVILLLLQPVIAQDVYYNEDSTAVYFQNGNIIFPFDNKGILANVYFPSVGNTAFYDGNMIIWSAGFALSGQLTDTSYWSSGVMTTDAIKDFIPGKVNSDPESTLNKIYVVKRVDPEFGESWQRWSNAVENGAYFYDGDEDGIYTPVDKNNNGKWDTDEDKPDILYNATFYTVFNDGKLQEERQLDSPPMGIEVRQTLFISSQNSNLNNVIFVRYSIVSKIDSLKDVHFAIWTDGDLGELLQHDNEMVGADSSLNSGYQYYDNPFSDFGINPPANFATYLQGPIVRAEGYTAYNNFGPTIGQKLIENYKNLGLTSFAGFEDSDPESQPRNSERLFTRKRTIKWRIT